MLRLSTRMAPPDTALNVRRGVLALSALLAIVGMYWIGGSFFVDGKLRFGNPVVPASRQGVEAFDREPRQVRAEVTRVTGSSGVRPGDKCDFLIERRLRDNEALWCNAQVVCGGRLIYGGPNAGFFPCRLEEGERRDVIGSEPSPTGKDGDGAIHINTAEGVMRVWDDASGGFGEFLVEAEILSVH